MDGEDTFLQFFGAPLVCGVHIYVIAAEMVSWQKLVERGKKCGKIGNSKSESPRTLLVWVTNLSKIGEGEGKGKYSSNGWRGNRFAIFRCTFNMWCFHLCDRRGDGNLAKNLWKGARKVQIWELQIWVAK